MENAETLTRLETGRTGWKKILIRISLFLLLLVVTTMLAFKFSPWPSTLIIRYVFNKGGASVNAALAKHVPPGITTITDQQYDPQDKDAFLDLYYPSALSGTDSALPVIVWIHGGGWVAGSKEDISNYGKILASKNYTVVSVNYSLAPGKHYPTPLQQVNRALAYLRDNARRFHIDSTQYILAGDSGGASIAAQLGNIICSPDYAKLLGITPTINRRLLSGLLLYCGPYDTDLVDLNGTYASFLRTISWAYSGHKDYTRDPLFKTVSVVNYVTGNYAPSFISVGNGDPLRAHSEALARKLAALQVSVDTLFFTPDYSPVLPHEYQFNLDVPAGKTALEQSIQFLESLKMDTHRYPQIAKSK